MGAGLVSPTDRLPAFPSIRAKLLRRARAGMLTTSNPEFDRKFRLRVSMA